MKTVGLSFLVLLLLSGCRTPGIQYSQNLFQHLPADAELVALVNPNDISNLVELAIKEINFQDFFGAKVDFDAEKLDYYREISVEMLDSLGIPIEKVEAAGVVMVYERPVFLLSGAFSRDEVIAKLTEIGFAQHDNGFFDYVYHTQKLAIPADGVMMMAEEDLLEDMVSIPEDHRLWDREDFEAYRLTSPLNNSVFLWSDPPKRFLSNFEYHDDLGSVSLALKLKRTITLKAVVRVRDPDKTVYLNDVMVGLVKVGQGLFGNDDDYGPLFNAITVTQDNKQVTASLVVPAERVMSLKERIRKDFVEDDSSTIEKLERWLGRFG